MYTGISLRGVCNVQYSEMAGTSILPTSSPGKVVEGWREARSAYLASEVPCLYPGLLYLRERAHNALHHAGAQSRAASHWRAAPGPR